MVRIFFHAVLACLLAAIAVFPSVSGVAQTLPPATLLHNGTTWVRGAPVVGPIDGYFYIASHDKLMRSTGLPSGTSALLTFTLAIADVVSRGDTVYVTIGSGASTQAYRLRGNSAQPVAFVPDLHFRGAGYQFRGLTLRKLDDAGQPQTVYTFPAASPYGVVNTYNESTIFESGGALYMLAAGRHCDDPILVVGGPDCDTLLGPSRQLVESDGTAAGSRVLLSWDKQILRALPAGDRAIVARGANGQVEALGKTPGVPIRFLTTLPVSPTDILEKSMFASEDAIFFQNFQGDWYSTDQFTNTRLVLPNNRPGTSAPTGVTFNDGSAVVQAWQPQLTLWRIEHAPFGIEQIYPISPSVSATLTNFLVPELTVSQGIVAIANSPVDGRCELWLGNGAASEIRQMFASTQTYPFTSLSICPQIAGYLNGRVVVYVYQVPEVSTGVLNVWSVPLSAMPRHTLPRIGAKTFFNAATVDLGGEGLAYHDAEAANLGNAFNSTKSGVDLSSLASPGTPQTHLDEYVSSAVAGEWLNYTLDIEAAGAYTLSAQVASLGQGGTFHFELDGINISGPMFVPDTGGWTIFRNAVKTNLALPAGRHALRLVMDSNGPGGAVGNFRQIGLLRAGWATQSTYLPMLGR